ASRVLDPGNNFLGGGFNSSNSCTFMACGGTIDDWVVTGTTHDITTSSTGGCGQSGALNGTFDASTNQIDGTWSSLDCNGNPSSGTFLAGKWGSTYDKHIQAMLLSLGLFADDIEAESLDAADVFHSSYLSDGYTRADWESQLSYWYSNYEDLQVEISGPSQLLTVIGSDVHPYLLGPTRVAWEITITGTHSSTGFVEELHSRSEPNVIGPGMNLIGVEAGRIVFTGNGEDQPLSIGLPIHLSDVSTEHYVVWPFGVHGGGHAEDGHPGIDFSYIEGAKVIAAEAGEITAITLNTGWTPAQWDITQTIRPGVQLRYGHIADPPAVSVGDIIAAGDIIGDPSVTSGGNRMIHFALNIGSTSANDDACPTPWFNPSAMSDWDIIWQLAHYSEELSEPLGCNDREADPPYVATWELETPGVSPGPDSILFFRPDGYAHNYVYTFLDAGGVAYETGDTEWMSSPSTIGLKFVATDGSGSLSFAAGDIVGTEMQLKIDLSMHTDMSGAAVYRFQE
ncbi:MAG: M23 family metallopeptidase, partial [Planctomycetes bacterium]|nr:M23 family metallopeptidase [Planctomycetota bacterium]